MSRNIILCGPPGTGKTFKAKELAMDLLKNGDDTDLKALISKNLSIVERKELNKKFKNILDSSIKFISFHQSFSYEDFVMGKTLGEKGEIKFEDGVLKGFVAFDQNTENYERLNLFDSAIDDVINGFNNPSNSTFNIIRDNEERTFNFSYFIKQITTPKYTYIEFQKKQQQIKGAPSYKAVKSFNYEDFKDFNLFKTALMNFINLGIQFDSLIFKTSPNVTSLNRYIINFEQEINQMDIEVINYLFIKFENSTKYYMTLDKVQDNNTPQLETITIANLAKSCISKKDFNYDNNNEFNPFICKKYYKYKLDAGKGNTKFINFAKYRIPENVNPENTKKVLIIDEINRGNISAIFGELITLLEKNYRAKEEEEISITLSSGESFTLPDNLYIIGTMNTADRSAEQMDTAMRRRFEFVELLPKKEMVNDFNLNKDGKKAKETEDVTFNLRNTFETINKRIEILKGKGYCIGHSYFMNLIVKSKENNIDFDATWLKLHKVMYNQIIPLLEEYFYKDIEIIGKVLSDGFIEDKNIPRMVGVDEPVWTIKKLSLDEFKTAMKAISK
jgi:5-methylcytosine-specific restriction protein B